MDWSHAFEQTRRRLESDLQAAKDRGATTYRFGQRGVLIDPSRLTSERIRELARHEAARITDRAINQHNEQVERASARR